MKRNEIVKEMSERLNLPKMECDMMLDTFAEIVKEALADGKKVIIRDFLTFEISERKERNGYNPYTGEVEKFSPVRSVNCRVGKNIKEAVKEVI